MSDDNPPETEWEKNDRIARELGIPEDAETTGEIVAAINAVADASQPEAVELLRSTPDWNAVAERLGTTEVEQYRELAYRSQFRAEVNPDRVTVAVKLNPEVVKALDAYIERVWSELDKKALSREEAKYFGGMSRPAAIRWILHRWLMLEDQW